MKQITLKVNKEYLKNKLDIKDGKTPSEEELLALIRPLIKEPKKQIVVEKTEIVKEIPVIKEVAKYETADDIAEKLNTLNDKIDWKVLKGVPNNLTKKSLLGRGIFDAPKDSKQYVRKDGDWVLSETYQETFESVSKNLKSYPYQITYNGDNIDYITYTTPNGTIIKTINYTGDNVGSIVLSGNTPSGISLTKSIIYSGDNINNIIYS